MSFVRVPDIDWIGAASYGAELHAGGRTHVAREPLQWLEQRLDPVRFVRAHCTALVNVERVRAIRAYVHGTHLLTLYNGTCLVLSRTRRAALRRALGWSL